MFFAYENIFTTKSKQITVVQEMMTKDGMPNPFKNDRPGDKWWKHFIKCHPILSLQKPEQLQPSQAQCCTPKNLQQWFELNNLHDLKDRKIEGLKFGMLMRWRFHFALPLEK